MKERRKLECPEKTPFDKVQKMLCLKLERSNPNRDWNRHTSIGGRHLLGKQTC